jgi:hypothetical protein
MEETLGPDTRDQLIMLLMSSYGQELRDNLENFMRRRTEAEAVSEIDEE